MQIQGNTCYYVAANAALAAGAYTLMRGRLPAGAMKAQFVAMALTGGVHLVAPKYLKVALFVPLVLMRATCAWKKTSLKVAGNAMLFLSLPQMFFGYCYSRSVWKKEENVLWNKCRQATTLDDALCDELRDHVGASPFLSDSPDNFVGACCTCNSNFLLEIQLNDENRRFLIAHLQCYQGDLSAQRSKSDFRTQVTIDAFIPRIDFLIMRLEENKDKHAWVQMFSKIEPNERFRYLKCILRNQPLSDETKITLSNQEFSDLLDLCSNVRNSSTQSVGDQYAMRNLTDLFRLVASHVGLEYALEKLNQIPKEKRQLDLFVTGKTDVYWVWWMAAHDAAGIKSVDQLKIPESVDLPDEVTSEVCSMVAAQMKAEETQQCAFLKAFLEEKRLLLPLPEWD